MPDPHAIVVVHLRPVLFHGHQGRSKEKGLPLVIKDERKSRFLVFDKNFFLSKVKANSLKFVKIRLIENLFDWQADRFDD